MKPQGNRHVWIQLQLQYLTKITYAAHAVLLQEVMRDRLIYTRVRLTALKTKTRGTRLIKSRRVDTYYNRDLKTLMKYLKQ